MSTLGFLGLKDENDMFDRQKRLSLISYVAQEKKEEQIYAKDLAKEKVDL